MLQHKYVVVYPLVIIHLILARKFSGIARPGPTRACALPSNFQALPSTFQALPSRAKQESRDSIMN